MDRPLRVDVWGVHRLAPYRFVEWLTDAQPSLRTEPSMRRSVWTALEALLRGELDVAFGRTHDLGHPWPAGLRSRIAQLEPAAALVSVDHPLAGAESIRPAELKDSVLSAPPAPTAPEMLRWFERFGQDFGLPVTHRDSGVLSDPETFLRNLYDDPAVVGLLPAGFPLGGNRVRLVPLAGPVPRYPWSVIWRRDDRSPLLARFLHHLSEAGRAERWTAYDPEQDWLPEPDRATLAG